MPKTATVVVLHVGASMRTPFGAPAGAAARARTRLSAARLALDKWVEHKVLFAAQDEIGLVLYGATNGATDEGGDGGGGVTVHNELERGSLTMLKNLAGVTADPEREANSGGSAKSPAATDCALCPALVTAVDMLRRRTAKKKYAREIIVLTDCGETGSIANADQEVLGAAIKMAAHLFCDVKLVAVDLGGKLQPSSSSSSSSSSAGAATAATSATAATPAPSAALLARRAHCTALADIIVGKLNGTLTRAIRMDDVLGSLSRRKFTTTAKYKHTLTLTSELSVNLYIFGLNAKVSLPSSKKASTLAPEVCNYPSFFCIAVNMLNRFVR